MCDCRKRVDEKLSEHNARLAFGFTFDANKMDLSPPLIQLEKVDKKKRGKLPTMLASFCPFCGEPLEKEKI